MIELLLSNSSYFVRKALKINEKNTTGFTALDVLMETKIETLCNGTRADESPTEPSREEIIVFTDNAQGDQNQTDVYKMEKILKHAGAKRSQITCCIPPHSEASKTKMVLSCGVKWLLKVPNFLSFKVDKDTSSDVRNALLVIFVLIVAVTYQTGVNPPGGLWQDNESITSNDSTNSTKLKDKTAGTPVWFDQNPNSFQVLMLCNYAGFLVSLVMVFNLTEGYPLRGPILLALLFMLLTYGLSIRLLFLGSGTLALLFHGMILTVPLPVALVLLVATANWIWEIK
ncbi:uncharacterized protein LOC122073086 [Macadamia integrifolia]|uniref:uncharacterized protein LOC122073086 n=1 Tax=Macadamia integrifolia TaxID=60698 RepID=UPI001C4F0BC3|nr:uncharacterized protein LOC122073086 [Macadamia integrifolia]